MSSIVFEDYNNSSSIRYLSFLLTLSGLSNINTDLKTLINQEIGILNSAAATSVNSTPQGKLADINSIELQSESICNELMWIQLLYTLDSNTNIDSNVKTLIDNELSKVATAANNIVTSSGTLVQLSSAIAALG
jgi:hypothetical protein